MPVYKPEVKRKKPAVITAITPLPAVSPSVKNISAVVAQSGVPTGAVQKAVAPGTTPAAQAELESRQATLAGTTATTGAVQTAVAPGTGARTTGTLQPGVTTMPTTPQPGFDTLPPSTRASLQSDWATAYRAGKVKTTDAPAFTNLINQLAAARQKNDTGALAKISADIRTLLAGPTAAGGSAETGTGGATAAGATDAGLPGTGAGDAGIGPEPELIPEIGMKVEQWKDASGKDVPISYTVLDGTPFEDGYEVKLYDPPSGLLQGQKDQWLKYNRDVETLFATAKRERTTVDGLTAQVKKLTEWIEWKKTQPGSSHQETWRPGIETYETEQWYKDAMERLSTDKAQLQDHQNQLTTARRGIESVAERQKLLLGTGIQPGYQASTDTPLLDAGAGTPISESEQYQKNLDLQNRGAGTAGQDAVSAALAGTGGEQGQPGGPGFDSLPPNAQADLNKAFGDAYRSGKIKTTDVPAWKGLMDELAAAHSAKNTAGIVDVQKRIRQFLAGGGSGGGGETDGGFSGSTGAIDDLFKKMNAQTGVQPGDVPPDMTQQFLNNLLSQSPDLTPEQRAVIERRANTAMAEALSALSARGMGQSSDAARAIVEGTFKKQEMLASEQQRVRTENTQFGLQAAGLSQTGLQNTREYQIAKGQLSLEALKNEQGFSIQQRITALQEKVGAANISLDNQKFQEAKREFEKEFGFRLKDQTFMQALQTGQLNLEAVKTDSATRIAELQAANDFIARSNEADLQAKLGFSKLELEKMISGQELDLKRVEQGIQKWVAQMGFDIDMTKLDLELKALQAADKDSFLEIISSFALIGLKGASLFASGGATAAIPV